MKAVWIVTGGLGFIGSNFIRLVLRERAEVEIINFDAVTYAGNPSNLSDLDTGPRYRFVRGDIAERDAVTEVLRSCEVDAIINFAAETHVDRSILDSDLFIRTNVLGTNILIDAACKAGVRRFLQVSTDEVYGDVAEGLSREDSPLAPRSPYAASKAAGDLQALAYAATYSAPVLITRGSNTYGPYQYPEKMIPLFITNLLDDKPVPVYGDGLQIRDWLHVEDHARGILAVLECGNIGEIYNLGAGNTRTNLEITHALIEGCGRKIGTHLRHVKDRPGHDRRYALDSSKARKLGWKPQRDLDATLAETLDWYREHEPWWRPIKSGAFAEYYKEQYASQVQD